MASVKKEIDFKSYEPLNMSQSKEEIDLKADNSCIGEMNLIP